MPVCSSFHTHTPITCAHTYSHTPAASAIHTHTYTLVHMPSHLPSPAAVSLGRSLFTDSPLLRAASTPVGLCLLSHSALSVSVSPPCLSFHGLSLCALDSVSLSRSSLPVPSSCYHSSSPAMPFSELCLLSGTHSLSSYLPASLSFSICLSLFPECGYILSPHIPEPGWTMRAGNG